MNRPASRRLRELGLVRGGFLLLLGVQACSSVSPQQQMPVTQVQERQESRVLGRDQDFAVVLAQSGDDLKSLAERYLGDARKAWWIAEFNGIASVQPGQEVVIPLRARNPVGVHSTGIQTVPILTYHRLGSNRTRLVVSPATFDAQMQYLAVNGYHVIPLRQLTGFLEGGEPLPRKAVVITLDDAYRSTYEIAFPILKKYGFPATVFLYSDFIGAADAMTWTQMQDLVNSDLIDIQPHSKSHGNLALRLPGETDAQYRERLRLEIEVPAATIRARLATEIYGYAFPYGDTNQDITDQLTRQGIRLGLTVTPGGNAFFANPLMLRRTMVYGEDDLEAFKSKLAVFTTMTLR
jgi:peptidoglycan/xylan/chitin deacetylase (PgdA/CDA1 family)